MDMKTKILQKCGSGSKSGNPPRGRGRYSELISMIEAGFLVVTLFGCGSSFQKSALTQNPGQVSPPFTPPNVVVDPPPPEPGYNPSFTYSFSITGIGGTTPEFQTPNAGIETDSILKVRVSSGVGGAVTVPGYSAYTMNYGCVRYKVTLFSKQGSSWVQNGQSYTTQILAVDGMSTTNCPNAAKSQIIDLSHRISGPGPIRVKIDEPAYDFYCNYWYTLYYYGVDPYYYVGTFNDNCPVKRAYKTHTLSGSVGLQVNGTTSP